jgi:polyferredoxin
MKPISANTLSKKTNYGNWRALSLGLVYLLIGVHIAYWKIVGRALAPLEFNEVLYTLHQGIITAGFIFMGIAILSTLIVGRFFCSWLCHIVALQDLSEWILHKLKIKPKQIKSRVLYLIPFFAVIYLFLLPQVERIYYGQPLPTLRIQSDQEGWASFITDDFWRNLPGLGVTLLTFIVCGFFIIYLLGSRSFCQYICPYGALFAMTDRITPGKIKLTGDCNQCGLCTAVCSSHIKVHKEILHFGKVVDHNCLKDLDCVQVCPNDALSFGFTKPSGLQTLYSITTEKKVYNFTWKEDIALLILFALFLPIYFGLYNSVAFLLALSISAILSFLCIQAYRLHKNYFQQVNKIVLKSSGKLTIYGKSFFLIVSLLIIFSVHSAFIRFFQLKGEHYYNKVAYIASDTSGDLNKEETQNNINRASQCLSFVYDWGLYSPAPLLRQLAALTIYNKDTQKAIFYLEKMLSITPQDTEARIRLSKLLITQKDESTAVNHLKYIINERAHTSSEKNTRSESLLILGHLEEKNGFPLEALSHYQDALKIDSNNGEAWMAAGVLFTRSGKLVEGEECLLKAAQYYPTSPIIENNLAAIYLQQKLYGKARPHVEKLLLIEPNQPEARYNLAMIKYSAGEIDQAKKDLQALLVKYPNHKNAKQALNRIAVEQ